MADHYETLGVGKDATPEEIKAAYRRNAAKAHPDAEGGAPEKFHALTRAYNTLRHEEHRRMYDEHGVSPGDEEAGVLAAAQQAIAGLFFQTLTGMTPEQADYTNIIEAMRGRLRDETGNTAKALEAIAEKEKQLKHYQRIIKKRLRRKKKKPDTLFTKVLDGAFNAISAERAGVLRQQEIKKKALEILKDYVYDAEKSLKFNALGNSIPWPLGQAEIPLALCAVLA